MSNTPNIPMISMNLSDLESTPPENLNNMFEEIFGIDSSLPAWASGHANGVFSPSAALATRDGRVTGNAVLMWWTILNGMPAAVVSTDAGNVMILTYDELEEMFYAPQFLMREPLYAHLSGVAAANVDIPDQYRFLFEIGGVPLDEDEDEDEYTVFETVNEGPNPLVVALMDALMGTPVEVQVVEDQVYLPSEDMDVGDDAEFGVSILDSDGNTTTVSFDTVEELNAYMEQMGIPLQF